MPKFVKDSKRTGTSDENWSFPCLAINFYLAFMDFATRAQTVCKFIAGKRQFVGKGLFSVSYVLHKVLTFWEIGVVVADTQEKKVNFCLSAVASVFENCFLLTSACFKMRAV